MMKALGIEAVLDTVIFISLRVVSTRNRDKSRIAIAEHIPQSISDHCWRMIGRRDVLTASRMKRNEVCGPQAW